MNWNGIKRCNNCGAGNPMDVVDCIRCGEHEFGKINISEPSISEKTETEEDVRNSIEITLSNLNCPSCRSVYGKQVAKKSMDISDIEIIESIKSAEKEGVQIRRDPIYLLKCAKCGKRAQYNLVGPKFIE